MTTSQPLQIDATPAPIPAPDANPKTDRRPPRRGGRRRVVLAALLVLVSSVLSVLGSSPAQAVLYAGAGVWGYNVPSEVTCRYLDAWGQLRTEVTPPLAYAYDRTAGAGNDTQQVRYRLFYVDQVTGASLGSSGWSGFAWAYDNYPARWSGVTMQSFDQRKVIRVETRIEFYNGRTGVYEGWTAHTADRYWFYPGYATYGQGPMNACGKN